MKKLLNGLLILGLIFISSCSEKQDEIKYLKSVEYNSILHTNIGLGGDKALLVDPRIEPYMLQFVSQAKKRNKEYYFGTIINKVDSILINPKIQYPSLGYFDRVTKTINVPQFALVDTLILRQITFHELGHIMKDSGEHTCKICRDIMSEASPRSFYTYAREDVWEYEVDKLFNWIRDGGED